MARVFRPFAALALLGALPAAPAAAKVVEEGGYKYFQISLSGLWGGFFVFLLGIVFCLVGLFLVLLWRRASKPGDASPAPGRAEEEDTRVF
jgi:hypothetical protein